MEGQGFLIHRTTRADVLGALPHPQGQAGTGGTEKGSGEHILQIFLWRTRPQKPNPGLVRFPWLRSLDSELLRWYPFLMVQQVEG